MSKIFIISVVGVIVIMVSISAFFVLKASDKVDIFDDDTGTTIPSSGGGNGDDPDNEDSTTTIRYTTSTTTYDPGTVGGNGGGDPPDQGSTPSVSNCVVDLASNGKSGEFECDIDSITCDEDMFVTIVDGSEENTLIASVGDFSKGKIELTETKLSGAASLPLSVGFPSLEESLGCAQFVFICGDDPIETTCSFA